MCENCYREAGSPWIVTDRVHAGSVLYNLVYEFSLSGGRLHVVLDDFNIDDSNVAFCAGEIAQAVAEDPGDAIQIAVERACCEVFAVMTRAERATTLGMDYAPNRDRDVPRPSPEMERALTTLVDTWDAIDLAGEIGNGRGLERLSAAMAPVVVLARSAPWHDPKIGTFGEPYARGFAWPVTPLKQRRIRS